MNYKMNILVTGGAGFVGTNLIKTLLKQGHNVTSIDNYNTGLESNHQPGAKYLNYDIRNVSDYSSWGKFDIVYHLAAIARIQPSFELPYDYFTTNALATFKIAEYCSKNNIPLIYAGSSSHHSGKFKNPYTFSKDIGEEIINLFETHYKLKATITRFYNVYGPYHLKEGGYCTVIGKWEKAIEDKKPLIIYGDGTKRRDFTHIDDIVDALIKIKEKEIYNVTFELGRGENFSIKEIADIYQTDIIYEDDKPGEAQNTLCDNSFARLMLGWEPTINIKDYVKNYLNGE